ncbi:MAG: oligosaccharide flippase family protein [candidate division WOR-3 bacterium]
MPEIEKMEELKKIFSQSFQYFLSLIIIKLITTLNGIFLARFLLSEKFGIYTLINQLTLLLSFFAGFGLPVIITKFIAQSKNDKELLDTTYQTAQILVLFFSCLVIIFYFSSSRLLAEKVYKKPFLLKYFYLTNPLILFLTFNTFWIGVLQGLKEIKSISLINICYNLLSLPLIIFLTKKYEIYGAISALILANLFGNILFLKKIKNFFSLKLNFDFFQAEKIISLAFPTFLSGLVMVPASWLVNTKLAITKNFSEVAYFNIANTFFQLFLFIPIAIGMPLTPIIAEEVSNLIKIKKLLNKIINYSSFLLLLLLFLIFIFLPKIILIFLGKDYLPALKSFLFVVGAIVPVNIGYIFGYYLTGTGKMWLATFFNAVWFFIFIFSVYLFTYKYGALGVGISFYAAYFFQVFSMIFYFKTLLTKPFLATILLILNLVLIILFYKFL